MKKTANFKPFMMIVAGLGLALWVGSCAAEYRVPQAPQARVLATPFGKAARVEKAPAVKGSFKCPSPPPPMTDLQFESMYSKDSANASVIDPEAYDAYQSGTKPLRELEAGLASLANRYTRSDPPQSAVAACVQNWLVEWAGAGALQGDVNRAGEHVRKWVLASIASAWLQVRDDPNLNPGKRRKVEDWIRGVAQSVQLDFNSKQQVKSRQNNHLYWAAWAVMATGLALDDRSMFDWGLARARQGISHIQPDGTLPLEMDRGQYALSYHSYAAIPLFMMAEAAAKNGIDIYGENDQGLARLGRRILDGLKDPSYFEEKSGTPQNTARLTTSTQLVWLEPYYARTGDPDALAWLEKLRPMKFSRVGGDATMLYAP